VLPDWRAIAGAGIFVMLLGLPSTVAGQDADALVARGIELRRQGQDEQALALFRRAHRLSPSGRSLAQIALAEQALGSWMDAHQDLVAAIALGGGWIAEHRETLDEALSVIRRNVGLVTVEAEEPVAAVTINGGAVEVGVPVAVQPGAVEIVVRFEGEGVERRTVELSAGRERVVTVARENDAPSDDASGTGGVPQDADDAADTSAGDATDDDTAGSHDGATDGGTDVLTVLGWTALVTAAAAFAGAVVAWRIREGDASRYNDDAGCYATPGLTRDEQCPGLRDAVDQAELVSIAALAAGGALTALGVLLLVLADGEPSAEQVGLDCAPGGPGDAGVACRWRF
jgi:hypothetical protein